MMEQLLHTELGLWATAANLPSFSPQTGMLLLEIRNRAVEAVGRGIAIEQSGLRQDIRKYIDALDLVCGVAAVQQAEAIKTLEKLLERDGHKVNTDDDSQETSEGGQT